jgi:hypothetical protein
MRSIPMQASNAMIVGLLGALLSNRTVALIVRALSSSLVVSEEPNFYLIDA